MRYLLLIILGTMLLSSCKNIKEVFEKNTPYESYLKDLKKSGLNNSAMVTEWISWGNKVFQDSLVVSLPFSESGGFQKAKPRANSYRFNVNKGQVLIIKAKVQAENSGRLFIDLFVRDKGNWQNLAYADSAFTIQHEFNNSRECLLRLQPELLINVFYVINITLTPSLANPVSGASNSSIGSVYGDPRDGGNRSHEGVDIFAPRGTPVIAPTDGYVTRVGTNKLGGKVIWMRDHGSGNSYYFAHLDSQLVSSGSRVQKYDTIGTVGNTGNARTTPPHLHFGIYQRGSIDPIHFIREMPGIIEQPIIDTALVSEVYSVSAAKANLRSGPGTDKEIISALDRHTHLKIIGKSKDWYRVQLPDDMQGYIADNIIAQAQPLELVTISGPTYLLGEAAADAVPVYQLENKTLEIRAIFDNFQWVHSEDGETGWIFSE